MQHQPFPRGAALLAALAIIVVAARPAAAQTPTPAVPQPAVQGAAVPAGGSSTFAGVTINNRLSGEVTITLAEQVLTITARSGTPPFVIAPGSGGGCVLTPPDAATGARCPAPPGTTITLIAAAAQAPTALPRTGTGLTTDNGSTSGWGFGIGIVVVAVAGMAAVLRSCRRKDTSAAPRRPTPARGSTGARPPSTHLHRGD